MVAPIVDAMRNDITALDDALVVERFRQLELEVRRVEAQMSVVVAEVKRRSLHQIDGHRSMQSWLRANANLAPWQVTQRVRRADLVDSLTPVIEELAAGHIGIAQADQLARVAANPRCGHKLEGSIITLLEQAEQLPFNDARACLQRWVMFADLDGAHRQRELNHQHRTATVIELDQTIHVAASGGTAIVAAELQAIFTRFVEAEFAADVAERTRLHGTDAPASLLARTDSQRRFDALVALFRAAAAAPEGAGTVRAPMLVNLLIDQHSFDEALAAHGLIPQPTTPTPPDWSQRRCETTAGTVVMPDDVARAALDGYIRRVVINTAGVPINAGRTRRLFSGVARELAVLLGHHCDQPGCTVPSEQCDVDHLEEWVRDGGLTDLDNAGPRCNAHNRAKQRLGQRAYRDRRGRPHTQRRDGTWIHPVGQRQLHERAMPPPNDFDLLDPDDANDEDPTVIDLLQRLARQRVIDLVATS